MNKLESVLRVVFSPIKATSSLFFLCSVCLCSGLMADFPPALLPCLHLVITVQAPSSKAIYVKVRSVVTLLCLPLLFRVGNKQFFKNVRESSPDFQVTVKLQLYSGVYRGRQLLLVKTSHKPTTCIAPDGAS